MSKSTIELLGVKIGDGNFCLRKFIDDARVIEVN
jgi:hypothetical protein